MKVLYYLHKTIGVFPHMFPYYKKFGGKVFTTDGETYTRFRNEYPFINITVDLAEAFKYNADVVIYGDYVPKFPNSKSVQVFHGIELKGYYAIKKDWNICEEYDLCLLYGDKSLNNFKNNGWNPKYKLIGYPRFDNIVPIPFNLFKNDRKTLLIAPTWSDESLLKRFHKEIVELSEQYNVILKIHSLIGTPKDCNESYMKYISENADPTKLLIYNNSDILPFMKQTDLMITDYSGSSCEYMLVDKPIIIADPKTLKDVVASQLETDDKKEERNAYFKNLIYQEDGSTATERGIRAIEELVEGKND